MANIVYEGDIYNPEVKQRFLSHYKENTQKTLMRLFKVSADLEKDFQKDLYDFNKNQIKNLLFLLRPTKLNASKQNGSQISLYIDWAIQEGLKSSGINPLRGIPKEWYEQFVDHQENHYFTDVRLNQILQACENWQDKVIIRLLMEGVGGEGHSELLNLKRTDIDPENNRLFLNDDKGGQRSIRVSDECIEACIKALDETEYLKMNGKPTPGTKSFATNLIDNGYVIRSSITNTENTDRADKHVIYRRISVISKLMNEPNLSPSSISHSGMLAMAKDIYLEKGSLEIEDIDSICDTFGVRNSRKDGKPNYQRLIDEFLNVDTIKKIYNL